MFLRVLLTINRHCSMHWLDAIRQQNQAASIAHVPEPILLKISVAHRVTKLQWVHYNMSKEYYYPYLSGLIRWYQRHSVPWCKWTLEHISRLLTQIQHKRWYYHINRVHMSLIWETDNLSLPLHLAPRGRRDIQSSAIKIQSTFYIIHTTGT